MTVDAARLSPLLSRVAVLAMVAVVTLGVTRAPELQRLESLPGFTTGDDVGPLDGVFSVDGNGGATYQIELEVPPGTNDVAPELSLTYNSGRDNGYVGMGWALNGIESIGRCNAATVPNGYIAPVSYDSLDRFCAGNMPLLAVSGEYGADGTEYRTMRDTWTRFVSHGQCGAGPCWFSAYNKDGAELRFGYTTGNTGSRILASGRTDGAVRIWSQDRYTDTKGNYTEIVYANNLATAEYYPAEIRYTGNERTGLAPRRSVRLDWELRTDRVIGYAGGSPFQQLHRLTNIRTFVGGQLVTNYAMTYTYGVSTARSRLQSIRRCSSDAVSNDSCLDPTTLTMSNPDNGFTTGSPRTTTRKITGVQAIVPMDVDGDGRTDMVVPWNDSGNVAFTIYRANDTGFDAGVNQSSTAPANGYGVIGADVNGDGRGDLVQPYETSSNIGFRAFLSNGTNFGTEVLTITSTPESHLAFLPADVNADGREDVVQVVDNGGSVRYVVFLASGSGSFEQGVVTDTGRQVANFGFLPLDVNGDGRADIVQPQSSGGMLNFNVEYSTGARFEAGPVISTGRNPSKPDVQAGDVNGDQKADLILIDPGTGTVEIVPFLSTGTSFRQVLATTAQGGADNLGISVFNLNGDGRADLLQQIKSSGKVRLVPFYSLGDRFQKGAEFTSSVDASTLGIKGVELNGDGKQDVVVPQDVNGTLQFGVMLGLPGQPDLVSRIENGIGGFVDVVMKPLADPTVYTRGNRAQYPVQDVANSMPVVAEYTNSSGTNGSYRFIYHYLDGRVGFNGIGWLGFERVRMTDTADGRFSEITYDQTWPRNGVVIQSAVFDQEQVMLSQTTSDYVDIASPSLQQKNIHQIVRSADTFSMYDNASGGAKLYTLKKTFGYDDFGNVNFIGDLSQPNVAADDIFTCVRFRNDSATWRLGYIDQEKLTSTEAACRAFLAATGPVWDPATDIQWRKKTYDDAMNVTSEQNWDDSHDEWLAMTFTFDDYGNRITVTDAAKNTTTFTFDDQYHTFPVRIVSPPNVEGVSLTDLYLYNVYFGNQEQNTDPNGNVFRWETDPYGRVVNEYGPNPSGVSTRTRHVSYLRQANGYAVEEATRPDWSSSDDPAAWRWTRTYFDGLEREFKTVERGATDALNLVEEIRFDDVGHISQTSVPYFASQSPSWITTKYDVYNRPASTTQPDGTEERIVYELGTLRISRTIAYGTPEAQTEIDNLDSRGRIISRILPNGAVYRYTYARAGQLTNINTLPDRRNITFTYDSIGRMRTYETTNTGRTEFHFDDAGLMSGSSDADGNRVAYEYDGLGRVIRKTSSTAAGTSVTDFTFDAPTTNGRGHITRVTMNRAPVGDITYDLGYDAYAQTTAVRVDLGGRVYSYGMDYNPAGQVTHERYPDGTTLITAFGIDANPATLAMRDQNGNEERHVTYAEYNAWGVPSSVTYRNGVQSKRTFWPNDVSTGRIKTITATNANGSLYGREMRWNRLDNLREMVDLAGTGRSQTFTYDAKKMGFLTGATGPYPERSFGYNSLGSRTAFDSTAYTYQPGTDKIASFGANTGATWNGNGTLATMTSNGVTITFRYDADGRMVEAERSDQPASPARYVYDFTGNLVYQQPAASTTIKTYLPSSNFEVNDYGGARVLQTKYIEGVFGPAVAITTNANAPRQIAAVAQNNRLISARLYDGSANVTARAGAFADRFFAFVADPAMQAALLDAALALATVTAFSLSIVIALRARRRRGRLDGAEVTDYARREPRFAALTPLVALAFALMCVAAPLYGDLTPGENGPGNPIVGTRYFVHDVTGSVVSVTDDSGASTASVGYLPFGAVDAAASNGTNDFKPKYGGRPHQDELGLYYFGERFYDPGTGRFTTPDPVMQYVNPYLYAGSDPMSMVDPNGDFAFLIAIVIGGLVGAYMGASAVNHDYNPANWDWTSGKTYAGLFGGAVIGAIGGAVVEVAATAGVAAGIAGAVLVGAGESAAFTAMGGGSANEVLTSAIEGAVFGFVFGGAGAGLTRLAARFGRRGAQLAEVAGGELAASRGLRSVCSSFLGGLEVVNGDGGLQPIESVRVGQKVFGYHQETDAVDRYDVAATLSGETTEVTRITTESGNVIETTPAHLFRAWGRGWMRADQLTPNFELTNREGDPVRIRSVDTTALAEARPVYNLSVETAEDYFVSPDQVLVKNVAAACLAARGARRPGWHKSTKELVAARQTIKSGKSRGLVRSAVGHNVDHARTARVLIGKRNPRHVTIWHLDHIVPYRDLLWAARKTKHLITWKQMIAISNYAPNLRYLTMSQNVSHAFELTGSQARRGAIDIFRKSGLWK